MKLDYTLDDNKLFITLCGDYFGCEPSVSKKVVDLASSKKIQVISVDARQLGGWDSTLVVILYGLAKIARQKTVLFDLESLPKNLRQLIHLAMEVDRKPEKNRNIRRPFFELVGSWGINIFTSATKGLQFLQQTIHSISRLFFGRAIMRRVDFLFAMEDCSYKAVGIVSLVSFMVGLILAFVGAIQLKTFGAQIYVASLVTIGMIRIMGAIMVGIIMAGRTGASYAATIGTMQVNEEVDALKTMGIPIADFLVLPRTIALVIAMPFLTILADIMGMIGGAAVGVLMLGISVPEYYKYSIEAFSLDNFMVGIFHGFVFGLIISVCGCYYGVNSGRNADSVGFATTRAVVSSIVWMIVLTGFITLILEALGI